jgi:glutathione peroxidase
MNYKFIIAGIVLAAASLALFANIMGRPSGPVPKSIYDLKVKALDGHEVDLSTFRGRKLLIVNTASKCGKTPQYAGLEELHKKFGQRVTVLGFPANNFLWQEPGSNEEIAEFCKENYGVDFQMFEKISVKGRDQHPLYQWLESKTGHKPDWNFSKYLVSEDGTQVIFFKSSVEPLDNQIVSKL